MSVIDRIRAKQREAAVQKTTPPSDRWRTAEALVHVLRPRLARLVEDACELERDARAGMAPGTPTREILAQELLADCMLDVGTEAAKVLGAAAFRSGVGGRA